LAINSKTNYKDKNKIMKLDRNGKKF